MREFGVIIASNTGINV